MTAWSPLPSTMATDVRPTTTVVSAAVPPENQVWFTVSGRRVASLLLFFVLSETAGVLRSGARTYFYRTGAVCNCPQLIAPGEDGWSGSSYCGDSDGVIGFATRLSANLLFLQVGVDFLFTPVFAIARVAGWLAHLLEQLQDNRIFRPSQIWVGEADRTVP